MEDLSVKQLLATTNKILIVVAVLVGLNLLTVGWSPSRQVEVKHSGTLQITTGYPGLEVELDIDNLDVSRLSY